MWVVSSARRDVEAGNAKLWRCCVVRVIRQNQAQANIGEFISIWPWTCRIPPTYSVPALSASMLLSRKVVLIPSLLAIVIVYCNVFGSIALKPKSILWRSVFASNINIRLKLWKFEENSGKTSIEVCCIITVHFMKMKSLHIFKLLI